MRKFEKNRDLKNNVLLPNYGLTKGDKVAVKFKQEHKFEEPKVKYCVVVGEYQDHITVRTENYNTSIQKVDLEILEEEISIRRVH